MTNKKLITLGLLFFTLSVLVSVSVSIFVTKQINRRVRSKEELIADFYAIENAVHVSPHSIRRSMQKNEVNFTLVDLRSAQEYQKEHILTAINIPAYSDPFTPAYEDEERIIDSFRRLDLNKDVIVYCYSTPCMTGRKIGKMLAENGIYVKHLGIGWNEWRYHWELWNHDVEWKSTNVKDYIAIGSEPGVPNFKVDDSAVVSPCSADSTFGC